VNHHSSTTDTDVSQLDVFNILQIYVNFPKFVHIYKPVVAIESCRLPVELCHFSLPAFFKGWRDFVTSVFRVQRPKIFPGQRLSITL